MWSIGNEIGEANGDAHSLATVKRLVKVIKDVDKTRYVTMGADKFRFGNGSGGHEKIADELDAVGFNYSEDNYKALRAKHPKWLIYGSETSSATRTRGSYYRPERELKHSNGPERNYEQSDYGNDRVGWGKQQPLHGLLTVTTLAMLDSLSGQVRTILVNLHHGTTKIKLLLRALTLVL